MCHTHARLSRAEAELSIVSRPHSEPLEDELSNDKNTRKIHFPKKYVREVEKFAIVLYTILLIARAMRNSARSVTVRAFARYINVVAHGSRDMRPALQISQRKIGAKSSCSSGKFANDRAEARKGLRHAKTEGIWQKSKS